MIKFNILGNKIITKNSWVPRRVYLWKRDWPRSRGKIDPCPTGSATKPKTPYAIMPRGGIGEEPNSKSIDSCPFI